MANGTVAASQIEMLSQSGTGITTIVPPATNTNRTLTLPDNTGTVLTTATPGVPVNGPAFSAYNSSATSLSSGTTTKIAFQTEVFDTNSCFDSTTNYRFTPTVAGYYQINGSVRSDSTCSYLGCYVRKNGSDVSGGSFVSTSTAVQQQVVSTLVYLNGSTDYVELFAFVVTTVNTAANQAGTYFNGCLVRAA